MKPFRQMNDFEKKLYLESIAPKIKEMLPNDVEFILVVLDNVGESNTVSFISPKHLPGLLHSVADYISAAFYKERN